MKRAYMFGFLKLLKLFDCRCFCGDTDSDNGTTSREGGMTATEENSPNGIAGGGEGGWSGGNRQPSPHSPPEEVTLDVGQDITNPNDTTKDLAGSGAADKSIMDSVLDAFTNPSFDAMKRNAEITDSMFDTNYADSYVDLDMNIMGAREYSSEETVGATGLLSITTVSNILSIDITTDYHIDMETGEKIGFLDELAADSLEALGFGVTEANISAARGLAEISLSLALGIPMSNAALALKSASVAADIAYSNNAISAETYNTMKATIAITGVVHGMYTAMDGISMVGQYNSMLGFTAFAVTAYSAYTAIQDTAEKYGLDMSSTGISPELGIDGDGGGYSSLLTVANSEGSITRLVSGSANYMRKYEYMSEELTSNIYNTNVDYSKEESEMQSSYTDFRGGLNNLTAPHLLRKNEGQVYSNIDMSSGTIKSLNGDTIVQALTDPYFIKTRLIGDTEKHLVSSADYRHYAKMNGYLFFTSESEGFKIARYKDAAVTISTATIPKPAVAPTVEAIGIDEIAKELQTEYNYCYTYYSTSSGFESDPIYSDLWFATTQNIKVKNLAGIDNEFVDKIRLYRIGGYTTIYRLVAELDNPGAGATTEFIDPLHGSMLSFNLDTYLSGDVIDGLTGLTENRGTFFAYKDNRMYFTSPGKPNAWSAFNYLRFNDTISGLAVTPIGILVFTDNPSVYIVGGINKNTFSSAMLSKSIDCVSYKSVQNIKNASIWLSVQGLMMSLGASIQNITKSRVDVSALGTVLSSFVHGDLYYCICENNILVADFSYNTPSFKVLDRDSITQLQLDGVNLIGANSANLLDMYNDSTNLRSITYHSPLLINQHYDTIKAFSKVSIAFTGIFQFILYLDGIAVVDEVIDSTDVDGVAELNLLASNQEGKGLSVYISGAGEIFNVREIYDLQNLN
jgi:hypothetical protein